MRKKRGFQSIDSVLRDVAKLEAFIPLEKTFIQTERIQLVRRGLSTLLSLELQEKIVDIRLNEKNMVFLYVRNEGILQGLQSNRRQIETEIKKKYRWVSCVFIKITK